MKKSRTIFLIVGLLVLVLLLKTVGIETTIDHIINLGVRFWLIVIIFLFNNIFLTYAWTVLITQPVPFNKYYRFILARIAGDATSSINALGAAAGEPLKALYVKDIVPFRSGLASVILDRTIHLMGNLLMVLTGIIVAMFVLKLPVILTIGTFIFVVFSLLILIHVVKKQKDGFFEYIISRLPGFIRKKAQREDRLARIRELDEEIRFIFSSRDNLNHFYLSLSIHYISIIISGSLEIFLIVSFIEPSSGITFIHGLFVYIFGFILTSAMFFMPANVGTSEGSYSLALGLLGYEGAVALGVSTGIIRRLRTFVWSGIGIALLLHAGLTKTAGSEDQSE